MVGVELNKVGIVAQVDFLDTGFADVQDGQIRVVRYVEALYRSRVDRNFLDFRASRRVEISKVLAAPGIERSHGGIVAQVERRVEMVNLPDVENHQRRLVAADFQRRRAKRVVVEIQSLEV